MANARCRRLGSGRLFDIRDFTLLAELRGHGRRDFRRCWCTVIRQRHFRNRAGLGRNPRLSSRRLAHCVSRRYVGGRCNGRRHERLRAVRSNGGLRGGRFIRRTRLRLRLFPLTAVWAVAAADVLAEAFGGLPEFIGVDAAVCIAVELAEMLAHPFRQFLDLQLAIGVGVALH